ncbi:MAG: hypothetical protein ABSC54_11810 [Smithellaceae bacterium]|jgi:hypothetical protein
MKDDWKQKIMCAIECFRCHKSLSLRDERILSCYDHEAICMDCKRREEKLPDYKAISGEILAQCSVEVELTQSDPGSYCHSHFYPYKC